MAAKPPPEPATSPGPHDPSGTPPRSSRPQRSEEPGSPPVGAARTDETPDNRSAVSGMTPGWRGFPDDEGAGWFQGDGPWASRVRDDEEHSPVTARSAATRQSPGTPPTLICHHDESAKNRRYQKHMSERARQRTTHQSTHANTKNKMKVLITGSAGFIGNALSLRLLGRDDEVIGVAELTRIISESLENA